MPEFLTECPRMPLECLYECPLNAQGWTLGPPPPNTHTHHAHIHPPTSHHPSPQPLTPTPPTRELHPPRALPCPNTRVLGFSLWTWGMLLVTFLLKTTDAASRVGVVQKRVPQTEYLLCSKRRQAQLLAECLPRRKTCELGAIDCVLCQMGRQASCIMLCHELADLSRRPRRHTLQWGLRHRRQNCDAIRGTPWCCPPGTVHQALSNRCCPNGAVHQILSTMCPSPGTVQKVLSKRCCPQVLSNKC